MSSTDPALSRRSRSILREVAWKAIEHGLQHGRKRLQLEAKEFPDELQEPTATFVTLHLDAALKGCIGHLEAFQPLILDVISNAHAAAFEDSRFEPVHWADLPRLDISISLLSQPVSIQVTSEKNLIEQLIPGVDGIILKEKNKKSTFLPSVWDTIDSPREFLCQLKRKAGLPKDYWSETLEFQRYRTSTI